MMVIADSAPTSQSGSAKPLVEDERISYVCVADYSKDSPLEKVVKLMIENMAVLENLKSKEEIQLAQYKRVNDNK